MSEKVARNDLDYLKKNLAMLRAAPLEEKNGGVLIAQIPIASLDPFCEFLDELVETVERRQEPNEVGIRGAIK